MENPFFIKTEKKTQSREAYTTFSILTFKSKTKLLGGIITHTVANTCVFVSLFLVNHGMAVQKDIMILRKNKVFPYLCKLNV